MRVYLPSTSTALAALLADGAVVPGDEPLAAFAVTPGLRAWYGEETGQQDARAARDGAGSRGTAAASADDAEELEFAATAEAAHASIWLLDADQTASRRRVVIAADIADHAVEIVDDPDPGSVLVREPIALAAVASIHMDDETAEETIAAAAAEIDSVADDDEEAIERVDEADALALSWFATQELPALLASL